MYGCFVNAFQYPKYVDENRYFPLLLHIVQLLDEHVYMQWLLHGLVHTVCRRPESAMGPHRELLSNTTLLLFVMALSTVFSTSRATSVPKNATPSS